MVFAAPIVAPTALTEAANLLAFLPEVAMCVASVFVVAIVSGIVAGLAAMLIRFGWQKSGLNEEFATYRGRREGRKMVKKGKATEGKLCGVKNAANNRFAMGDRVKACYWRGYESELKKAMKKARA